MRRFFKSAAFPILLVVILAFVAQKVISSPSDDKAPSYNELVASKAHDGLIATGKVEEITVNTKDNTLDVTLKAGTITAVYAVGNPKDGSMNVIVRTTGGTASALDAYRQAHAAISRDDEGRVVYVNAFGEGILGRNALRVLAAATS